MHGRWTAGEYPEVHARAIRRLFDAGITHVFIHAPRHDQARVIDFFGRHVLPRLREPGAGSRQPGAGYREEA